MGNSGGSGPMSLDEFEECENIYEDILEPMARSTFVSEISEGITTVIFIKALEVILIASVGTIKLLATSDDSGEELIDDYDNEIEISNLPI